LSLHVLPFICNVDENGIFHVANFAWGLRLLQWSTNPLFFKWLFLCDGAQPHITDSAAFLRLVGGDLFIFVVLFTRDCSCITKRFATVDVFGYIPHSSSLAKIQLAFCSQESLAYGCVGSCCFKSKRLLTKPLPSKQQIYYGLSW
jgi:hypothetical protein